MTKTFVLCAVLIVAFAAPAAARRISDAERMRQQAEHLCYDDVQRLCNEFIPDEDKITACMDAKRKQLSAPCLKVFEKGLAK
jgi:hypothetical protein